MAEQGIFFHKEISKLENIKKKTTIVTVLGWGL